MEDSFNFFTSSTGFIVSLQYQNLSLTSAINRLFLFSWFLLFLFFCNLFLFHRYNLYSTSLKTPITYSWQFAAFWIASASSRLFCYCLLLSPSFILKGFLQYWCFLLVSSYLRVKLGSSSGNWVFSHTPGCIWKIGNAVQSPNPWNRGQWISMVNVQCFPLFHLGRLCFILEL